MCLTNETSLQLKKIYESYREWYYGSLLLNEQDGILYIQVDWIELAENLKCP